VSGSRDALIEPHIPALRRYAWALCRNAQDADDLVQECLLRALGRWHLRRPEGSVRAWLFAILHNGFISGRRQEARRPRAALPEADERAVEAGQEHAVMLDDVGAALDTLPEEQRAVLLLVGVEDLTYEEAARVLAVPIGTVMSRLSRGRERLRRGMENGGAKAAQLRRVK
jgi:RNA polymerase sigma-70 factor (ECF subfamily)